MSGRATVIYSNSALFLHEEKGEKEVCVDLSCLVPESHGLMFHLLLTHVYLSVFIFVFF